MSNVNTENAVRIATESYRIFLTAVPKGFPSNHTLPDGMGVSLSSCGGHAILRPKCGERTIDIFVDAYNLMFGGSKFENMSSVELSPKVEKAILSGIASYSQAAGRMHVLLNGSVGKHWEMMKDWFSEGVKSAIIGWSSPKKEILKTYDGCIEMCIKATAEQIEAAKKIEVDGVNILNAAKKAADAHFVFQGPQIFDKMGPFLFDSSDGTSMVLREAFYNFSYIDILHPRGYCKHTLAIRPIPAGVVLDVAGNKSYSLRYALSVDDEMNAKTIVAFAGWPKELQEAFLGAIASYSQAADRVKELFRGPFAQQWEAMKEWYFKIARAAITEQSYKVVKPPEMCKQYYK